MSKTKGGGSTRTVATRTPNAWASRTFDGTAVKTGSIIIRQRGTLFHRVRTWGLAKMTPYSRSLKEREVGYRGGRNSLTFSSTEAFLLKRKTPGSPGVFSLRRWPTCALDCLF